MRFNKKPQTKPQSSGKKMEPTAEIGESLFLRSLINLPYRALALKLDSEDGKESTLGKEIVKLIKQFTLDELYDTSNEKEMKSFDYSFGRFKDSIAYMKDAGFKASAELFVKETQE